MGQLLTKKFFPRMTVTWRENNPWQGKFSWNNVPILKDAEDLFAVSDLVIDFTAPKQAFVMRGLQPVQKRW